MMKVLRNDKQLNKLSENKLLQQGNLLVYVLF